MDAKQVIRSLMAKTGTSQEKLAKKSGMKGQSNITGILNRYASLRVDTMDQLVSAMGYKVMVVPEAVKCRDGWYEIGSRDEKEDANKNVEESTSDLQLMVDVLGDVYPNAEVSGIAIERISEDETGSD